MVPASLLPVVVVAWIAQPRVATNRPSYAFRETVLLATALLAVPCVHALARLTRRPRVLSRSTGVRRWLWSAAVSLAALPVVLTVAGALVHVPGHYGDAEIPGLAAGILSAAAAATIVLVTSTWALLARVVTRRPASLPE